MPGASVLVYLPSLRTRAVEPSGTVNTPNFTNNIAPTNKRSRNDIDGGNNEESGGTGGSSYWGGGNHGGSHWDPRDENAGAPGSGGGGTHASSNNAGSAGMPGIVVVEEYK